MSQNIIKMIEASLFFTNRVLSHYSITDRAFLITERGPYIYDVHMEGGWGSLEICHVFADSNVLKQ